MLHAHSTAVCYRRRVICDEIFNVRGSGFVLARMHVQSVARLPVVDLFRFFDLDLDLMSLIY